MSRRIGYAAAALAATLSWQVAAQTLQEGRAPLLDGQVQELRREVSLLDGAPGKTERPSYWGFPRLELSSSDWNMSADRMSHQALLLSYGTPAIKKWSGIRAKGWPRNAWSGRRL